MGKKAKFPSGTWIERDLFLNPAFIKLRGVAAQLFIVVLGKRKFSMVKNQKRAQRICTNSDRISFSYKEGKALGISQPAFTRAIDELLAKGFIEIVHQGGACQGDKTIFKLSEQWRFWQPGHVFSRREKDCVKRGFRNPKKQK